jgi:hypothetical protein
MKKNLTRLKIVPKEQWYAVPAKASGISEKKTWKLHEHIVCISGIGSDEQ